MDDGREVQTAVVQFDPQDEYAQMHDDNPDMDDETARRYEREGVAHGGHDDTVALVPKMAGSSYPGANHRAEQLEFTVPFSMARDLPWLVAGSSLNDNQYSALTELLNRFFRDYGDAGTYKQFLQYLDDPALKEELHESGRARGDLRRGETPGPRRAERRVRPGRPADNRTRPPARPPRRADGRADLPPLGLRPHRQSYWPSPACSSTRSSRTTRTTTASRRRRSSSGWTRRTTS